MWPKTYPNRLGPPRTQTDWLGPDDFVDGQGAVSAGQDDVFRLDLRRLGVVNHHRCAFIGRRDRRIPIGGRQRVIDTSKVRSPATIRGGTAMTALAGLLWRITPSPQLAIISRASTPVAADAITYGCSAFGGNLWAQIHPRGVDEQLAQVRRQRPSPEVGEPRQCRSVSGHPRSAVTAPQVTADDITLAQGVTFAGRPGRSGSHAFGSYVVEELLFAQIVNARRWSGVAAREDRDSQCARCRSGHTIVQAVRATEHSNALLSRRPAHCVNIAAPQPYRRTHRTPPRAYH